MASSTRRVEAALERWAREVYGKAAQKPGALRQAQLATTSGIPLEPLYVPRDTEYEEKVGFPGEYPFTRGIQPTMYRGRFWTMRQYAGFGTAEETNRRFRYLLASGQTGLSTAFDLPTQMGHDSDSPRARGEVGRVGVAIDSVDDMERLFKGIDLGAVSTSMTINATAATLLALYQAVAEAHGTAPTKLSGTIQNDVLKEYMARGTYIYPPGPSLKITSDIFEFCRNEIPEWNTISISGYHIREAGSTAVQEVAFTLANGLTYVQAALDRGLAIDDFAPRLSFFFNAHNNFLEEVAKFRAARRMWARIMKDRFHARNPKSLMLRFHTQTAGSTLTAQQPENNIVRTALQAMAAVLGGTQSLHTNGFDEALGLPTEEAARIALRTQQIVGHETGVANTVDPLAGSYYIESLTNEIERRAQLYLDKIEALGGTLRAIEQGYIQQEIQNAAYDFQQGVDRLENVVVGVNRFQNEGDRSVPVLRIDEALEGRQVERLRALRQRRDKTKWEAALRSVEDAARGDQNLMPHIIHAVESYCTVGEISDTLRKVFGEYQETVVI